MTYDAITPKIVPSPIPPRPDAPWIAAEHVAGFVLGLALSAMAFDYGTRHPTNTLPSPTPIAYPSP